jgi:hypothetical protein
MYTLPYIKFIYMICPSLNIRPHGCIPMPLPLSYKNIYNKKNVQFFSFIVLSMKLLGNPKIDANLSISNLIQMKWIKNNVEVYF